MIPKPHLEKLLKEGFVYSGISIDGLEIYENEDKRALYHKGYDKVIARYLSERMMESEDDD